MARPGEGRTVLRREGAGEGRAWLGSAGLVLSPAGSVNAGTRPLLTVPACLQTLAAVLTALARSSPAELTISALSLALLVPVKELNVRFRDRLPTPIPGEVVMVRATLGPCLPRAVSPHPHPI